jgi:hypothetical protein
MAGRDLTRGENEILVVIQRIYGPQNTADEVFFTSGNEAVLFIRTHDGTSVMAANITNLAAWRGDGTIPTEEELERKWLRI